ncbi:fumarylacetoacetate hydrolase family protein [Chryseobacterium proteolyticum]|uniref:fumarylacetoacetate hydrolase family protein n=1 Tax=Chryseobacterium proteolyticum TaxID=118127 RepID=UPI0039834F7A
MEYVAGYSCFNDVTVREYQFRTIQWMQGKNFDGHGPIGPMLVTPDEIEDLATSRITLRLNGEVMQESFIGDLIFDVPTLIEAISEIMTLNPGDIIATGTPSGVGFGRTPKVFMQRGDVVEVEITNIGLLQNTIK